MNESLLAIDEAFVRYAQVPFVRRLSTFVDLILAGLPLHACNVGLDPLWSRKPRHMNPEELRSVFALFEKSKKSDESSPLKSTTATISARELGTVLRSLGQSVSEADLLEMVRYMHQAQEWLIAAEQSGGAVRPSASAPPPDLPTEFSTATIGFDMFSRLLSAKVREVEVEEEIKSALSVFELPDKPGFLSVSALRTAVSTWGERLTADEVDELLADADASEDGLVVIEELVRAIMSR